MVNFIVHAFHAHGGMTCVLFVFVLLVFVVNALGSFLLYLSYKDDTYRSVWATPAWSRSDTYISVACILYGVWFFWGF